MISALRGAIFEALKREEEIEKMYERLAGEAKDHALKEFFSSLARDARRDTNMLKHLDLHSIIKFGLAIKFDAHGCKVDEHLVKGIADKANANELLKIATDQMDANIEYYEHIAAHSIFPDVKRLFRIIADKELEHKCLLKSLSDFLS
jgi:rubrerythrin